MAVADYREIYIDPTFKKLVLENKRGHLKLERHLCVKPFLCCFNLTLMSTLRGRHYLHFTEVTIIPRVTWLHVSEQGFKPVYLISEFALSAILYCFQQKQAPS